MSDEKPKVRLANGEPDEVKVMFLVTVKTSFQVIRNEVVSNKEDLSKKEVLEVERKEVVHSQINELGVEVKNFNQRQEFYIKNDAALASKGKGDINFKYISSVDPRVERSTQEKI